MIRPSVERILQSLDRLNYRIYDTPSVDWNLNIVGIRNKSDSPNRFDDVITLFHRFMNNWDIYYYPITTDPSPHYLKRPINANGTAILKEGQYIGTHAIDIHQRGRPGAHKALCQRLGNVTVYRDNNKNSKLDYTSPQSGMFGINIHRGPRNGDWDSENTIYSAGCQVFADSRHFDDFMQKCEFGRSAFGNKFTYTLLNERDL